MSDSPITSPEAWPGPAGPVPGYAPAGRYFAVATYVLIALCVLVFLLEMLAGGSKNPGVLLDFGASYGPYLRQGQYWRLVMPMFLHVGWWHLLMNMYALYLLGPILEQIYGYGRFSLIYVGAGMAGSLLSMARSDHIAAGASGAIFGLAGGILAAGYLHRQSFPYSLLRIFRRRRFSFVLLVFVVVNLIIGYAIPGIDIWGHLGGLAGGALLGSLIPPPARHQAPGGVKEEPSEAIVLVPLLIVALSIGMAASRYHTAAEVSQLLEQGERLRAAHQTDQAIARFQEAERRAPGDERPHQELGALYLDQRQYADAIREYQQALRINPASPQAQLGLAVAYQQTGETAKAQKLVAQALGKNASSADVHEALADLCAGQKLYPQAIQQYQEALKLDPNLAVAHNNLAWLYATSEDLKFRDRAGALEHARRAVELTKWRQADFTDTLAEALFANGDFDEAVRVQTKTLQLQPNNPDFRQHMDRYRRAAESGRQGQRV